MRNIKVVNLNYRLLKMKGIRLMKKIVLMCLIAMFVSVGCIPPGQVKKQTAPGQVKKHVDHRVKIK